ncbi:hypothetical protein VP01_2199g1 [Puccinia sorghi]|uniref:Uncharacterized protein n=1 Tax=Puccinia sorghi TaxID=27349 RepID=A0A0L6VAU9_9BASI|nr:hypothetical protein VP01_2199g1 [Puccinia sorghi]
MHKVNPPETPQNHIRLTSFSDFQNWRIESQMQTIARTKRFLKKDKFHVDSHSDMDWLKTAVNTGKSEVNLILTMFNPSHIIKQAAREDLLAAHAAHQQEIKETLAKQKSATGKDDKDNLDDEEHDTVGTHQHPHDKDLRQQLEEPTTKTLWKGITLPKAFKIVFDLQSTNHNNFIEKVASESNRQFTSAGPIWDATRTGFLPIQWHVSSLTLIAQIYKRLSPISSPIWPPSPIGSPHPGVVENQATAAVEAQNHLLSVEAARNASSSRRQIRENSNDSDHEVSPSVFEDSINLYMEIFYKKHLPNKKYDSQFPVFIDPCNPNRYILLSMGAVQTCARALVRAFIFFFGF